ncbi:uncharacterized protein LOC111342603 isoform X2 [Stylophora pistillata]|nr:uncharacterized protein LOC111342603 isoform X2 [Stylophora pistillata]
MDFKFIFSFPLTKHMTRTEKFVQWSCIMFYCLGGATFLLSPQIVGFVFKLDLEGYSGGYLRLLGLAVFEIGFIFIISARSFCRGSRYATILTSVVDRLVWANFISLMLVLKGLLPFRLSLFWMVPNSIFAFAIVVIWSHETKDASVNKFVQEATSDIRRFEMAKTEALVGTVFVLGIVQFFFWSLLVMRPDFSAIIFQLDKFSGFSQGFLASYFFVRSAHGLHYTIAASSGNICIVSAFVCCRIFFNVPIFFCLLIFDQIEKNLFIALSSLELLISTILLTVMMREKHVTVDNKAK